MSMTKEEVIAKLKDGLVSLEFEKVDGTIRPMVATLAEHVIPPRPPVNFDPNVQATKRTKNESALAVWDMDVAEWRSFRWDKLRWFDGVDLPNGVQ